MLDIIGVLLRRSIQCCYRVGSNGVLFCLVIAAPLFVFHRSGYGIAYRFQTCYSLKN